MKTNYLCLLFVSALAFLSGCQSMPMQFGTVDRSDLKVKNPYPEYEMQVKVAVGRLYPLGPSTFWWKVYPKTSAGKDLFVQSSRMIVGQEALIVAIEWFDVQGNSMGKASQVFQGLGYQTCSWHVEAYRTVGQLERYVPYWCF